MLHIEDLVKHFHVGDELVRAIDGVSLDIDAGKMVALYGPSGSGKSTLIDLIAGFQPQDAGTVLVDGRDIQSFKEREHSDYLLRTVGIVSQEDELLEAVSARKNASVRLLGDFPKQAEKMIEPLLVDLGLGDRMNQPTHKLSKGERQRVMIAQALSTNPRLILADEPTGNLDTRRSREVLGQIRDLCRRRGTAVLLVTHDPQAVSFADHVHELRDGHLHDYEPDELYVRATEPRRQAAP
jgi:putative ABC transport system ATP-binding protein